MVLETGMYKIFQGTSESNYREVGRYPVEDLSLLPKHIYVLERNMRANGPWLVEQHGDENHLKALGATTGCYSSGSTLVALLIPESGIEESWVVTEQPQHGSNMFTVESSNREKGWVAVEEGGRTRIHLQPLISTKSLPPQFPPTSLFHIVRVDNDD